MGFLWSKKLYLQRANFMRLRFAGQASRMIPM
jgi:hypothetical protein